MQFVSLQQAIQSYIADGMTVALEGFTHLIPFAAGHEIIRQGRKDLTLIRMTPDLIYDQLIGMGCAKKLVFSWGGNPGVGSLHRLRDAVERHWPLPLELDERSHAAMAAAWQAGAARLPMGLLKGYTGTDLLHANTASAKTVFCPFSGEELVAVPALNPDVTVIHAQAADRQGNIRIEGIIGPVREAAMAARTLIVTVEAVVEQHEKNLNAIVLPHWMVDAVALVPGGAYPSYAQGLYQRDNKFYQQWDDISRDRDRFLHWMQQFVLTTSDHQQFLKLMETER